MSDNPGKRTEYEHEDHTYPHNQQVHESAVIKNFYGTVTQFLDQITREKDGQGNKEDIDKQNDPAWQIPHIGKIHQIVAAV